MHVGPALLARVKPARAANSDTASYVMSGHSMAVADRGLIGSACAVTALFVLIAWSYDSQVAVVYAYEGYLSRAPDPAWVLVNLVLALTPLLWLPMRPQRASSVTLWVLYLFTLVPICAVASLVPTRSQATSTLLCAWSVAFFFLASLGQRVRPASVIPSPLNGSRGRTWFAVGAAVLAVGLFARFGIPTQLISLSGAYVQRLEFRQQLAGAHPAFGYLVTWSQTVVAPLMLVSGIARRRPAWLVGGCGLFAWGFLINGSRQALAATPFAVMLYVAGTRKVRGQTYAIGATALLGASAGGYSATGNAYALGPVAERLFAVPGVLSSYYYDYFLERPPVLLRDGTFSFASVSPYPDQMTYLIGREYLGRAEANANVNLIADSFANFWLAGLVAGVVLAAVLWVLDSVTVELPLGPIAASLCLILLAMSNVGLTVTLLTSGLGLMIVLLWLFGHAILVR